MRDRKVIDIEVETDYEYTPEQRCYEAAIERALRDALHENVEYHIKATARSWLMNPSLKKHSFLWMCDELNISTKFIKRVYDCFPGYRQSAVAHFDNVVVRKFLIEEESLTSRRN